VTGTGRWTSRKRIIFVSVIAQGNSVCLFVERSFLEIGEDVPFTYMLMKDLLRLSWYLSTTDDQTLTLETCPNGLGRNEINWSKGDIDYM
jgi:hypothetical protein